MKTFKHLLCLVLYLTATVLQAQNVAADQLTLSILESADQKTWSLDLNLENAFEGNYTAFQMDLTLPEGVVVNDSSWVNGSRIPGHIVNVRLLSNGKYRILGYSADNTAIQGNTGSLLSLTLGNVVNTVPYWGVSIRVSNVIFAKRDGTEVFLQDVSANVYSVVYKVDGVELGRQVVQEGKTITPLAQPEKEGYTFSGWTGLPEIMPSYNIEVGGYFTVNQYHLIYKVDGVSYQDILIDYGTPIFLLDNPVKEGHTFSGWSEVPELMPAHDVEILGSFTVNTYKLVFKVDGEVYQSYDVQYGATVTLPDEPVKEGYTFKGWSAGLDKMPAYDVEVEALFSVNNYQLVLMLDSVVYKTLDIPYGTKVTLSDTPVKEGHTFSGWSGVPEIMPAHNVEVYGSFSVNSYTITCMVDGVVYSTEEVKYGDAIVLPDAPVKEGHTFSGWSDVQETMPAHNVEVYGSFSVNTYTMTYMVDGVVYSTQEVKYGDAIVLPDAPVKEGHTFSGWSDVPEIMPAHNVEVYGSFSVNTYTITYMVDGVAYSTQEVKYGDAIVLPDAPVKEGHTFSGWSDVPKTMPAHNVEVCGKFSVNTYTITYILNGKEYATQEVKYGEAIVPLEVESSDVERFLGWEEMPKTMPAHDLIVQGKTELTGIDNLSVDTVVEVYTLQGVKVASSITWQQAKRYLRRGVYVVNGEIVYVK